MSKWDNGDIAAMLEDAGDEWERTEDGTTFFAIFDAAQQVRDAEGYISTETVLTAATRDVKSFNRHTQVTSPAGKVFKVQELPLMQDDGLLSRVFLVPIDSASGDCS